MFEVRNIICKKFIELVVIVFEAKKKIEGVQLSRVRIHILAPFRSASAEEEIYFRVSEWKRKKKIFDDPSSSSSAWKKDSVVVIA